MRKKPLYLVLLSFISFTIHAQDIPSATTIDANLSLVFPGSFQRIDTGGNTMFLSTVDRTTYLVARREQVFQQASASEQRSLLDEAANAYMQQPKFRNTSKQEKDTVIGNTPGKLVRMTGLNKDKPYLTWIFLAVLNKNIYSVSLTSFNDEATTRRSLQWFYAHVVFHQVK